MNLAESTEPFTPRATYNKDGDLIEVLLKPVIFYGEWISHELTILRDQETDEVVGCVINGARRLINEAEKIPRAPTFTCVPDRDFPKWQLEMQEHYERTGTLRSDHYLRMTDPVAYRRICGYHGDKP